MEPSEPGRGVDAAPSPTPRHGRLPLGRRGWTAITALEVLAASVAIVADLFVPTLVLLALMGLSLLARHEGLAALGLRGRPRVQLAVRMLGFAAAWSVVQLGVVLPIAERVSGTTQDLSDFRDLQGDVAMLVGLLLLSWTLAALGEELAYRGYLQTRMRALFGHGRAGLIVAVALSSVLFGVAHTEQGVIGVTVTTLDAVAFSVLRYRCRTLWASVLAHGFNNTIGFIAFFLVGPIHGLW
jgi:membrane protease YdiL (CAAX protease family)